jgi:mono/diheme cytochrome c family protein/uncharacterized membrane protein
LNRNILFIFSVLSVGAGGPATVLAEPPALDGQRDLASEVRGVFAAKCAGCHGPDLARPKGRFGYVLDLARVAGNREMVVPGRPDESELWELVRRGEMPPVDSPTGALTARQKEVIEAWIAARAPSTAAPSTDRQASTQPPVDETVEPTLLPFGWHFLLWLGKIHLLVLHFPIALLAAAVAGECWSLLRRSRVPSPEVRFCVFLGTPSAILTAALGWLHALGGNGAGMHATLTLHRWLGTAAGMWAVVTLACFEWDARRGIRSLCSSVLLFVGAPLIGLTGHFGGVLVHGADFLTW